MRAKAVLQSLPLSGLQSIFAALVDLVLPGGCAACPAPEGALCPGCLGALSGPAYRTTPLPAPARFPPTWTNSAYDGPARAAILAHKEDGRLPLARPLGNALALTALAALAGHDRLSARPIVVPMPSRPTATRKRGRDPMRRIAGAAVEQLTAADVSVELLPVLRMSRGVEDQAVLGSAARIANLSGALVVPARFERLVMGRPALIVDDVVTTGASLAEAARALNAGGAQVLGAAVIAATARRWPA